MASATDHSSPVARRPTRMNQTCALRWRELYDFAFGLKRFCAPALVCFPSDWQSSRVFFPRGFSVCRIFHKLGGAHMAYT